MTTPTNSAAPDAQPLLSLTLRDGDTLALYADRITVGAAASPATAYPVRQITQALLVYATPPVAGQPLPPPAVLARLDDGRAALFTPQDAPAASHLLDRLHTLRPDLRPPFAAPPPGYGYAPSYGYNYTYGYRAQHPSGISESERLLAGFSHLSAFVLPIWFALVVWLVTRGTQPYASQQAKQAFFFHLIMSAASLLIVIPSYIYFLSSVLTLSPTTTDPTAFPLTWFGGFFILWGALGVVSAINLVAGIIGAVHGFQGKPFHYPFFARL